MFTIRHFCIETNAIEHNFNDKLIVSDMNAYTTFLKVDALSPAHLYQLAKALDNEYEHIKAPEYTKALEGLCANINMQCADGRGFKSPKKHVLTTRETEDELTQAAEREIIVRHNMHVGRLAYMAYRAIRELAPFQHDPMNGLVGRAVWLWIMNGELKASFLHTFHDQTLAFGGAYAKPRGA